MAEIRVHTFRALFPGLPAAGPFDIKLLAWLGLAGLPYEQVFEDNPRKGPKGKIPWIELDGQPIGDTEIIIARLAERFGIDLDEGLSREQKALGHAWRRSFEEHFHQVLEWELMVHPAGAAFMQRAMEAGAPPVLGRVIGTLVRRMFARQLHARGIARHPPEIIAAKGRADIDALSNYLGESPYLLADRPVSADAAVFGLLAPTVYWPMPTPVAEYARIVPNIKAYCDRMRARCFGSPESTGR